MFNFFFHFIALPMLSFSIEYEVINKAKIVEGVDRKPDRGTIHGLEYSPPSDIYGPESLFFLNGLCFSTPIDRYIYHVCPFQNITQTRVNGNTKGTLLGVWGDWIENGYSKMKYHKGQSCSRSDRSVIVDIACGQNIFGLIPETVQEIESCEYHMTFAMPIACRLLFEGRVALKEVEFATQVPVTLTGASSTSPPPPPFSQSQHGTINNSSDRKSDSTTNSSHPNASLNSPTSTSDFSANTASSNTQQYQYQGIPDTLSIPSSTSSTPTLPLTSPDNSIFSSLQEELKKVSKQMQDLQSSLSKLQLHDKEGPVPVP